MHQGRALTDCATLAPNRETKLSFVIKKQDRIFCTYLSEFNVTSATLDDSLRNLHNFSYEGKIKLLLTYCHTSHAIAVTSDGISDANAGRSAAPTY